MKSLRSIVLDRSSEHDIKMFSSLTVVLDNRSTSGLMVYSVIRSTDIAQACMEMIDRWVKEDSRCRMER